MLQPLERARRRQDDGDNLSYISSLHWGSMLRLLTVTLLPFSVRYEILATVCPSLPDGTPNTLPPNWAGVCKLHIDLKCSTPTCVELLTYVVNLVWCATHFGRCVDLRIMCHTSPFGECAAVRISSTEGDSELYFGNCALRLGGFFLEINNLAILLRFP